MNAEGYTKLYEALQSAGVEATIAPIPPDEVHVEYVTLTSTPDVAPALVLNAISAYIASHVPTIGHAGGRARTDPKLNILGTPMPGSITFYDEHIQPSGIRR